MSGRGSRGSNLNVSSILVAGLSSAFGVGLLQVIGVLTATIENDQRAGQSETVGLVLGFIGWVFIVIAIYVGAIVTANTFATIVAGRARTIALLRLLGSSARTQRRAVAREGLSAGLIGGIGGALLGTGVAAGLSRIAVATGVVPDAPYSYLAVGALWPRGRNWCSPTSRRATSTRAPDGRCWSCCGRHPPGTARASPW